MSKLKSKNQNIAVTNDKSIDYSCKILFNWTLVKQYNKRSKKNEWRARFRLNKKPFTPKADNKRELELIIAEIRRQENREKTNEKHNTQLEVISYIPSVEEVFEKILPTIKKRHQRTLSERVFKTFLYFTCKF